MTVRREVLGTAVGVAVGVSALPEWTEIAPELVQKCAQHRRNIETFKRVAAVAGAVAIGSAAAARVVHYNATGDWGEGLLKVTLRLPGRLWLKMTGAEVPKVAEPQLTKAEIKTLRTEALFTGASGFFLATILHVGNAYDREIDSFNKLGCDNVEMVWRGLSSHEQSGIRARGDSGFFREQSELLTDMNRFARNHQNLAVGVFAVGLIAAGAAVFFSGGAALAI